MYQKKINTILSKPRVEIRFRNLSIKLDKKTKPHYNSLCA